MSLQEPAVTEIPWQLARSVWRQGSLERMSRSALCVDRWNVAFKASDGLFGNNQMLVPASQCLTNPSWLPVSYTWTHSRALLDGQGDPSTSLGKYVREWTAHDRLGLWFVSPDVAEIFC